MSVRHDARSAVGRWLRAFLLGAAVPLFAAQATADPARDAWRARYEAARAALIAGDSKRAAAELEELADNAPSPEDARLAAELLTVARGRTEPPSPEPHIRTSDELSVLYTSAVTYGLGTSGWVVLQLEPKTLVGAALPFVLLTSVSVGGVAFADSYRPFRRGVPHSIATGLYLGVGEGVWIVGLQHASASRRNSGSRWGARSVASVLWAGSTAGGVVGGVVGAWREPTPGRTSYVGSAAIWAGVTAGFVGAAIESDSSKRGEVAFLTGGIAYNLGIIGAVATAPVVAPSIARVRFADLGTLGGGLLGAGIYAVAAESKATVRGGLASAAAGMVSGLGLTWWLTRDMPHDPPEPSARKAALTPTLTPRPGGMVFGIAGEL